MRKKKQNKLLHVWRDLDKRPVRGVKKGRDQL